MVSKFLAELSDDYKKLFETEIGYDVIIYAGEEPNVKEIHAHSNILCVRSQYFRAALSNEWAKKVNGKFILKKQNIKPHLFDIILRFIYYGDIELKNLQGPDALNLLIAVDELNIHSLITYIQEYLVEHQIEFLRQNPTSILEIIYKHETFTDLWNFSLERICEEPKILFDSNNFINLKASLLEILLKRDDLNMDEIEILDNLLKWCLAQHNMINDPTKWSKDDIIKIERSLHRFIPSIRFYGIEPTEFFYKVYRYKEILPRDLIHDLLEFHIVPNKNPKINIPPSRKQNLKLNLIIPNHNRLFASWIDKKDSSYYNKKNVPYDFKLLYRSSRDGFDARIFHKNCDNKGATIWIAKIEDSTKLIGGYNPLDWNGDGWKYTRNSFLFNFADWKNISNSTTKLSYINNNKSKNYAIYCNNNYGPHMGDLYCSNSNNWTYDGYLDYYPNLDIPKNIIIEDYEVYQVIKK